jgi:hypothetical protein
MKKLLLSLLVSGSLFGLVASAAPVRALSVPTSPLTQFAACASGQVLTFPAWYRGLQDPSTCDVKIANLTQIWVIPLNIIEIMMQIAGYAATGLLIWGGIKYATSQGEPSHIKEAKDTILNAIIGLGIVLSSVAIINFIASKL